MEPVALLHQWSEELGKTALFIPLLVSTILLFSFLYLQKLNGSSHKLNLPPSPPKLPIIGNLHQLGMPLQESLTSLSNKYGHLMLLHFGNTPTLVVSSADIAQEIVKNHDIAFANRPQNSALNFFFYGCIDLAFCPYGEYWRQVRKICVLELLSQKRVQHFHFVREKEVMKMVEKIRLSCLKGAAIDLSEILISISINIISGSAFGRVYENEEGDEIFGGLVRRVTDLIGAFSYKDLLPFLGFMDVLNGFTANVKNTSKALHDFLDQVIEKHHVLKCDDDSSDKKDIVDILLHLQKEGMLDFDLTRENLKAILLDMFVAGTDSTATVMNWAVAQLIKNPSIMKKAQEEVRRVVAEKSKVNESDLNEMVYLKCILKETLRLHGTATIARQTSTNVTLEGYYIPPKTRVLINAWKIQRDPKLWEKPEEFIPERFLNNPVDVNGQHKQYIPFGAGRRVCPGISYALKEIEFVLANLLYFFDWKLPDGGRGEDLDMSEGCTLVRRKKLPIVVLPAVHSP